MSEQRLPFQQRPIVIAGAVVLLHMGGLAALQSGLLVRAYEAVLPVEMISQLIEPPKPLDVTPKPAPPPPEPKPTPKPPEPIKAKAITPPPAPQPLAIADPTPAPNAPVATPTPPAPLPPISAPVAAVPTPSPPPSPAPTPPAPPAPKIELPRADADYLNNPRPPYPPVSKRMGEQGRVIVRVFVGADGLPQKSELRTSSTFDRLDAAAVAAVMNWRFRPGMRGGVPEAMWVNVPLDFELGR